MISAPPAVHLAVALDGAGWHPAAWREAQARPGELFTARYWVEVIQEAERGLLDFVTIETGSACSPLPTPSRTSALTRCADGSTRCSS